MPGNVYNITNESLLNVVINLKEEVVAELNYLRMRFCNGAKIHRFANVVSIIYTEIAYADATGYNEVVDEKIEVQMQKLRKMM